MRKINELLSLGKRSLFHLLPYIGQINTISLLDIKEGFKRSKYGCNNVVSFVNAFFTGLRAYVHITVNVHARLCEFVCVCVCVCVYE